MRWCGIWFCLEFVGECRQKRVCCCKMDPLGRPRPKIFSGCWNLLPAFPVSSVLSSSDFIIFHRQVLPVERRKKSGEVEFPSELISTLEASRWEEMVRAENTEADLIKFELSVPLDCTCVEWGGLASIKCSFPYPVVQIQGHIPEVIISGPQVDGKVHRSMDIFSTIFPRWKVGCFVKRNEAIKGHEIREFLWLK